jgi:hypothetical protein
VPQELALCAITVLPLHHCAIGGVLVHSVCNYAGTSRTIVVYARCVAIDILTVLLSTVLPHISVPQRVRQLSDIPPRGSDATLDLFHEHCCTGLDVNRQCEHPLLIILTHFARARKLETRRRTHSATHSCNTISAYAEHCTGRVQQHGDAMQ